MAPGNQPLYTPLSLKISGIIKLLSHCVWFECACVVVCVRLDCVCVCVCVCVCCCPGCVCVCVCVCVWEGWSVTEIDGEGKAGHYVV